MRRRIRVVGERLQTGEPASDATPAGSGGGPGENERRAASRNAHFPVPTLGVDGIPGELSPARLPTEITGVFRHLFDAAKALSQQAGRLAASVPEQGISAPESPRPLPRNQRRPQRVELGKVNAKRSVRFSSPAEVPTRIIGSGTAGRGGDTPLPADGSPLTPEPRVKTEFIGPAKPVCPWPAPTVGIPSATVPAPPPPRGDPSDFEDNDPIASHRGNGGRLWVPVGVSLVLGLLGGWLLHEEAVPTPTRLPSAVLPVAPAPRPPVNPAATALVNQALRAEKAGDVPRAVELFTEAERTSPDFPGIRYRLALLALRRGETSKTRTLLERSLASGEEVAAVHNLQSALLRLENQPQLGFMELEAATRADPFNPKYFYFWAEALRKAGHLTEAAEKLEDALARTTDPADESLYQFKLRLVKIDLNREDEFAAELASHFPQGATIAPAEWLLTAAALDLKMGNYSAAAVSIRQARRLIAPATAAFLLNDQTFRDHGWRPELAAFYPGTTPPSEAAASPARMPTGSVQPGAPSALGSAAVATPRPHL